MFNNQYFKKILIFLYHNLLKDVNSHISILEEHFLENYITLYYLTFTFLFLIRLGARASVPSRRRYANEYFK